MDVTDLTVSQQVRAEALCCAVNLEASLPREMSPPPLPDDGDDPESLEVLRAAYAAMAEQANQRIPMIESRVTSRVLRNAGMFAAWIETGLSPGDPDDELRALGGGA
jgi:hypothetical protein